MKAISLIELEELFRHSSIHEFYYKSDNKVITCNYIFVDFHCMTLVIGNAETNFRTHAIKSIFFNNVDIDHTPHIVINFTTYFNEYFDIWYSHLKCLTV